MKAGRGGGSLLHRSGWRHWRRHPWQAALAVSGIAMGVAMVVAVDLASESARSAYRLAAETLAGRATHRVLGLSGDLPDSLYATLRLSGLRNAAGLPPAMTPVLEVRAQVLSRRPRPEPAPLPESGGPGDSGREGPPAAPGTGAAGTLPTLRLSGVDPFAALGLQAFGLAEASAGGPGGLAALVARPGAALLSRPAAERLGARAGDTLALRAGSRIFPVTVIGFLEPRNRLGAALVDDLALADLATVQEALGAEGRLGRIELDLSAAGRAEPPGSPSGADTGLVRRVRGLLPPGAVLQEEGARARDLDAMTRAFRVNLAALSLLALLVGAFLVYNAMAFSVAQRWGLLGALRGLGAAPGDIARLVCREALVLAALGSALGVLAGALLGRGLVSLVARTLDDLYFATHVAGLRLDPWVLAKGGLLGLGLGVLAALGPAWQAARIRPRVLLTRSAQEARLRGSLPRLNLAGALAAALSALLAWLPGRSLAAGFASLALAVAAWSLWTPGLLRRLSAAGARALQAAARVAGRRGPALLLGRMAARGTGASLSRTGVAAAALMAALSVTVAMGVMVDSFRRAVRDWLEAVLVADAYASAPRGGSGRLESGPAGRLDPGWLAAARALPAVAGTTGYLAVTLNVPAGAGGPGDSDGDADGGGAARGGTGAAGPVQLLALDMDGRSRGAFRFLEGDSATAWPAFHRVPGCAVLVSEPFAYRRGLHPGMGLRLPAAAGPREFPVAGVFADYGTDRGAVMMDRACFDAHWEGRGHTSAAFFARPGFPADSLARALGRLPGSDRVEIRSSVALRAASLEIFDRTFAITSVLRLAAVIIAAIGLVGALAALELERAPETALLRALGLTPRQTWGLAAAQAAFLGLCTALLAVPLGLAQAGLLVHVINRRSFGWSLPLHVDPRVCLEALLLGLGAALAAAALPAWRSSRAVTARALREE